MEKEKKKMKKSKKTKRAKMNQHFFAGCSWRQNSAYVGMETF